MGKGGRRNPRQNAAYFIKAIASYHGNLCVHLQDADTSLKLEHALENLKIDQKGDETFSVGTNVLVAVTESGTRKFRRAAIDTNGSNSLDATDLDTNEYYSDIDPEDVYNIACLGNKELIEAQGAQPYYVHSFHATDCVVNPKKFDKALRALKGVRWLFEKTGEKHYLEEEISIIKLYKENKNCNKEIFANLRAPPREIRLMPQLFCGSIEEVRVYHSAETMGVQLRYLPLHELRRLEVFLMEALRPEVLKTCDATSTQLHQLVAASYEGRRVRGLVTEVRPTGATVYLMDYGIYKRFRFPALSHLLTEYAFKLPRYGLCVKLAGEPEDYFDDRIVKVELKAEIDEFMWQGSILEESPECAGTDTGAEVAESQGGDPGQSEAEVAAEDSEENAADPHDQDIALSRELVNYLGSTNEAFVGSNDDSLSSPSAQTSSVSFVDGEAAVSEGTVNEEGIDCAGPSSSAFSGTGGVVDNLHEVSDGSTADQKDSAECPVPGTTHDSLKEFAADSSDVVNTSVIEQPDARWIPHEELEASKNLPTLVEPPLDAGSARMSQTHARESKVEHPGIDDIPVSDEVVVVGNLQEMSDESSVPCVETETAPVVSNVQDSDANPPEMADGHSVQLSIEKNSSNNTTVNEAVSQPEQPLETSTHEVAAPNDVDDTAVNAETIGAPASEIETPEDGVEAPVNESEALTADGDADAAPLLAVVAAESDPSHVRDEDTCRVSSEATTKVLATEDSNPGETLTDTSSLEDPGACGENPEVPEPLIESAVPAQVVDVACSPTETSADESVITGADQTVAADHMITAEQGDADTVAVVDTNRESVHNEAELVVEHRGMKFQVPEEAGGGDIAENQKQLLVEANAEPENPTEIPAESPQASPASHDSDAGIAGEIQSGNVASLEDISHTLQGTDHALIVQFGPSRSSNENTITPPSNENTLRDTEVLGSEPVAGNICETPPASVVDDNVLAPKPAETERAATPPADTASGIKNQPSRVHEARFSGDERPVAAASVKRGFVTGATKQAIGLQFGDFPEKFRGTLDTELCEEEFSAGQFDDAPEDVPIPEVGQKVENDVIEEVGIDSDPVPEMGSAKPMKDSEDQQLQNTDAVVSREEPVQEETREVSVEDTLPRPSTAGDQTTRSSPSSSCRKKEVEIYAVRKNPKIFSSAIRDLCDFPQLSFELGRVLIAKVVRVVNSRHVLMKSDVILASIEDQLSHVGKLLPDTYIKAGKTVLVEHDGKLKRACIAESMRGRATNTYHVYLLDYSVCLSNPKLFRCPPEIAAMHRALLFVKCMARQVTKTEWVGKYFSLYIDRFEGSVINGLLLRDPNRNYEAALPTTRAIGTKASG